jgi:3-deoxy-D-manno-octulosonic-acid transferase
MWWTLYQALLVLAYPVIRLRLLWRARREPEYGKRISERSGRVSDSIPTNPVWFHTVSAGETIAAAPLIRTLTEEFPELDFLVTTMTPTGSLQVTSLLADCVSHCYAPYDFRRGVRRFYDAVAPRLLVLMETELWPNLIHEASARGVPAVLVNARLSHRSARGYARIGSLTRTMLEQLSFIACQYPDHSQRFIELGADRSRVGTLGNVKFDVQLPEDHGSRVSELRAAFGLSTGPVWIAASTHAGEEEIVLAAHRIVRESCPDACLLLVPRHPARADEVARLIETVGFTVARQSKLVKTGSSNGPIADVILADSMGQLLYLYGLSNVAFLGGSLVPVGGHNPIEAAICAQPLLAGPATFNFPDIANAFTNAGCLDTVHNAAELAAQITKYLTDPTLSQKLGKTAQQVVSSNTGATNRLLDLLRTQIRAAIQPNSTRE